MKNRKLLQSKAKLKRRGKELYQKYFYNSSETIEYVVRQYDSKQLIDNTKCDVVFDITDDYIDKVYKLIKYYPKKLKELKFITNEVIDNLYIEFGETMEIMLTYTYKNGEKTNSVRNRMYNSAYERAKDMDWIFTLKSEDIKLIYECPLLNIPLVYKSKGQVNASPSLDRIDSTRGYTKDNIQVISSLANRMKNNATEEQLITFAGNVLKLYKKVALMD